MSYHKRPSGCLTIGEVAELAGVTKAAVRYWIKKGKLKASQREFDKCWFIREADAKKISKAANASA